MKSHVQLIGSASEHLEKLEVRVATSEGDWRLSKSALFEERSLGAGAEEGDRLCQLVYEDDQLVSVLIWCAAAIHLKDCDEWVGWDAVTRAQRLKRVVQNRRFLVLEVTRRPNLASQSLGAALRKLVDQWESEHGYRPLLAETCGHIITLCRHEDGRPVAMPPASGKKEDCEVPVARALLVDPGVELLNAVVTADPLHSKKETVRVIAEKGGDYLIGTKEKHPKKVGECPRSSGWLPLFALGVESGH